MRNEEGFVTGWPILMEKSVDTDDLWYSQLLLLVEGGAAALRFSVRREGIGGALSSFCCSSVPPSGSSDTWPWPPAIELPYILDSRFKNWDLHSHKDKEITLLNEECVKHLKTMGQSRENFSRICLTYFSSSVGEHVTFRDTVVVV
jgi:hypothetical protein